VGDELVEQQRRHDEIDKFGSDHRLAVSSHLGVGLGKGPFIATQLNSTRRRVELS